MIKLARSTDCEKFSTICSWNFYSVNRQNRPYPFKTWPTIDSSPTVPIAFQTWKRKKNKSPRYPIIAIVPNKTMTKNIGNENPEPSIEKKKHVLSNRWICIQRRAVLVNQKKPIHAICLFLLWMNVHVLEYHMFVRKYVLNEDIHGQDPT